MVLKGGEKKVLYLKENKSIEENFKKWRSFAINRKTAKSGPQFHIERASAEAQNFELEVAISLFIRESIWAGQDMEDIIDYLHKLVHK